MQCNAMQCKAMYVMQCICSECVTPAPAPSRGAYTDACRDCFKGRWTNGADPWPWVGLTDGQDELMADDGETELSSEESTPASSEA